MCFKQDQSRESNYIEIKLMTPTVSKEGVVESWRAEQVPMARSASASAICECKDVAVDPDLGVVTVNGKRVATVRILVSVCAIGDDEQVSTPDKDSLGTRVTRRVTCGLNADSVETYTLRAAGTPAVVSWLIRASAGDMFFITAAASTTSGLFTVLGHWDAESAGRAELAGFLRQVIESSPSDLYIESEDAATPARRKQLLDESAMSLKSGCEVTKRRRRS